MISSMTGFASATQDFPAYSITIELRSVNHRYLELMIKSPDEFRFSEEELRRQISSQYSRGKIECRLTVEHQHSADTELLLNQPLLNTLSAVADEIRSQHPNVLSLSVSEIIKWPNMLQTNKTDARALSPSILSTLDIALKQLTSSRHQEGNKLKMALLERHKTIESILGDIRSILPKALQKHQTKLRERLQEALEHTDEARLQQEFTIFAQKIDIDEEIDRLSAHLSEIKHTLDTETKACGKKLDFLMQELNREANTICSKSPSIEITKAAVNIKVLIEQMREQTQNIE